MRMTISYFYENDNDCGDDVCEWVVLTVPLYGDDDGDDDDDEDGDDDDGNDGDDDGDDDDDGDEDLTWKP